MNINQTTPSPVILLGLHVYYNLKAPLFLLILILCSLTLIGNVMIVVLVNLSPTLHRPMFFFLSHLSLSDILLTINIVPLMLCGILKGEVSISLAHCITQFNFFCTALASECLLLTVMSFDRYLAICNPLRYMSIMNKKLRLQLVVFCWFFSFAISTTGALSLRRLNFCGPNVIDHFFCDFFPILQLSCSDTSAAELEQLLLATPFCVIPVVFIVGTYICIFITVLRIPSTTGRQKAFSTFSSHLSVVSIFFGSLIGLYVVPPSANYLSINKVISVLYTVVTPLSNCIIYSLRNSELRLAFKKYVSIYFECEKPKSRTGGKKSSPYKRE